MSTLGWPVETDDLARYYPGTILETGYDIIFFWVARMMMLGIHFMDRPPFQTVYLHGMVRDPIGKKMSKTAGNVVDPLEAIDTIGADALRFTLINGVSPGNDQRLSQDKLDTARNFANKLWNAARFVLGARPATHRAGRPAPSPDAQPAGARPSAGSGAGRPRRPRRSIGRSPISPWARRRASSSRRSGASCATGASRWPRSAWPTRPCRPRSARRPGGRSSRRSTRTSACSTRSCPS